MDTPFFSSRREPSTVISAETEPNFNVLPAPSPRLRASVILPARDEEESIECTLTALAAQQGLESESVEILLLCNNCSDNTAQVARDWAGLHSQIHLHVVEATFGREQANVGYARRILMDAACRRLESLPRIRAPRAICSTDADTRVFPDWIGATLREFESGAHAVGGRIYVAPSGRDSARKTYLLDTAYRFYAARLEAALDPESYDPWPRHFQFFGASLAVSPRAYRKVGGLPHVPCLEDMAFERALRHHDLRLRRSPRVRVVTSARRSGRVAMGLSTQLQEWTHLGEGQRDWLVPSGREVVWKAQLKQRLRRLFCGEGDQTDADYLSRELNIDVGELSGKLQGSRYFGKVWDDVWNMAWENPSLRDRWAPIEVGRAIGEMRGALKIALA